VRSDYEEEDELESFMKFHTDKQKEAERKAASQGKTVEELEEYDSEEEGKKKDKRKIEPLPPLDHSKIEYPTVEKAFYKPPKTAMTPAQIKDFRRTLRTFPFLAFLLSIPSTTMCHNSTLAQNVPAGKCTGVWRGPSLSS
jgi:hypothetical protein